MKSFITRLGDLTCGQVLAWSLALNAIFIGAAVLIVFQPQY